jgi:putative transposase
MALAARRPAPHSLVDHADRGVQYTCEEYTAKLAAHLAKYEPDSATPTTTPERKASWKPISRRRSTERDDRNVVVARGSIAHFLEEAYNQ